MGELSHAQESVRPFEGDYYNEEYQVYLHLNFYEKNMEVSGQEYLGPLPGYFSTKRDTRLWMIVEADVVGPTKAHSTFINDFGSEDFEASLEINKDGALTLKRLSGSVLKIVVDNKYVKLPKEVTFRRN
ncbi:MAG: hypothetical protein IKT00_08425 [Prevotella sp.]|nr:hypothetical protein [Prevotella sp.]